MTSVSDGSGRINQKKRTHAAIVEATRVLIRSGSEVTMPTVAQSALVSEATAYRYFPDLISLMREAVVGLWPTPAEALEPVEDSVDPGERVAFAAEFFLRGVLAYEGAARAMLSATITHPEATARRSGIRFGLIDHALLPVASTFAAGDREAFARLEQDLAVVVSAEALFCLIDQLRLPPEEAIASVVRTAKTVTDAAFRSASLRASVHGGVVD
jgi:AcrR family transcriptional regulator